MIYSLHYQGIYHTGNAAIRQIAKYCEEVFNVNLGNFQQMHLELRSRKMNSTKLLDALRETLIKKMEEQDEKQETMYSKESVYSVNLFSISCCF